MRKLARSENCLFLPMGDYMDLISTSERAIFSNPNIHESTKIHLEDEYIRLTKKFAKEIEFMRGKLIGFIEGNHYVKFDWGTSTQYLCQLLGTKYLGVCAFIRVVVKDGRGQGQMIDIFAHHGKSSGKSLGSGFTGLQDIMTGVSADLYLMGHDHKLGYVTTSRLHLADNRTSNNLRVIDKPVVLVRTGSYLKAYEEGKPSYIVDSCGKPATLGHPSIKITSRREHSRKSFNKVPKYIHDRLSLEIKVEA